MSGGLAGVEPIDRGDGVRERLLGVAALGVQRKPGPDRPWAGALHLEQELLTAAQALVAHVGPHRGDALAHRLDEIAPLDHLDAGAAFARALVLGSAPGPIPAHAAADTLRGVRPEARVAAADALALAPDPAVGPAVARLLHDSPADVCAAALSILRFRRQAAYGSVILFLAHPDRSVAAAAVRCLGTVVERAAAGAVLRHLLARGVRDALALPAAEILLACGDPAGLTFVRAKLEAESDTPSLSDDARVGYLRLLGLAGDADDRELFFRSVEPSARDAAAVGWFGHPDLVDWLLGSLDAANDARRSAVTPGAAPSLFEVAAARALQRILGTPGAPAGAPPPGHETLTVDASVWRSAWLKARVRSASREKLRFGRPYTPLATLDELSAETLCATRPDAALELAIASRGTSLLETDDWVPRQRTVLANARAALSADTYPAGAYLGASFSGR